MLVDHQAIRSWGYFGSLLVFRSLDFTRIQMEDIREQSK